MKILIWELPLYSQVSKQHILQHILKPHQKPMSTTFSLVTKLKVSWKLCKAEFVI